jgi:hypothetical protein
MARSNLENVDMYTQLIKGLQANFATKTPLVLKKQTLTVGEIVKQVQARVDARSTTSDAQKAYHSAVQAERESEAEVKPLQQALQRTLQGRFGDDSEKLKEFGIAPTKARKVPVATKAAAVAKGQATRDARGTKGPKEKLAIKGVAPAAPVAAATEGPAATPVVNGAPAAGGGGVVPPAGH